jgi:hypothetical protein
MRCILHRSGSMDLEFGLGAHWYIIGKGLKRILRWTFWDLHREDYYQNWRKKCDPRLDQYPNIFSHTFGYR